MRERQTGENFSTTVRRLASAQKGAARGAPAYSLFINRRLGRYLAALCFRAGLTPNTVTLVSAVFTFSGIALLATALPSLSVGIMISLLLAAGYAFDSADGQVARLRGGGSPAGEWLDHVVDCIKVATLHLAVLICFYRYFSLPSDALLLVPLGYTVVAVTIFFAMILNDQLKHSQGVPSAARPEIRLSTLRRSLLMVPTDYGTLCLSFLVLGIPPLFFVVYATLFVVNAAHLVLALRKWFRDMVALDPRPELDR